MTDSKRQPKASRWIYLAPLLLFALLVALLHDGLDKDPSKLPSAFLAKPLPQFNAPFLEGGETFTSTDLAGEVWLLNIWASWCGPCLLEHPNVTWLAEQGIPVVGLNYKDARQNALAWLQRNSNPFTHTVQDLDGRIGIELGVYGVPETFLVDGNGMVVHKHVGPMTAEDAKALLTLATEARAK